MMTIIIIRGNNNVVLFKVLEPHKHTSDDLWRKKQFLSLIHAILILFSFLISYQLSEPSVINVDLTFFTHSSGSCEDNGRKVSVFNLVHSFSVVVFLFIIE